jgi:hypothetical protein
MSYIVWLPVPYTTGSIKTSKQPPGLLSHDGVADDGSVAIQSFFSWTGDPQS